MLCGVLHVPQDTYARAYERDPATRVPRKEAPRIIVSMAFIGLPGSTSPITNSCCKDMYLRCLYLNRDIAVIMPSSCVRTPQAYSSFQSTQHSTFSTLSYLFSLYQVTQFSTNLVRRYPAIAVEKIYFVANQHGSGTSLFSSIYYAQYMRSLQVM